MRVEIVATGRDCLSHGVGIMPERAEELTQLTQSHEFPEV
jgi:hypothetical protein